MEALRIAVAERDRLPDRIVAGQDADRAGELTRDGVTVGCFAELKGGNGFSVSGPETIAGLRANEESVQAHRLFTTGMRVMDHYADVFDVRGHKYDAGMRAFPKARDEEFRQLFAGIDVGPLKTVYDIPSGGGYLDRFIASDADLIEFDPSADFGSQSAKPVDLEHLTLRPQSADLVVSLAALHHVANKADFFRTAVAALKPDGWLCVADVPAGSDIARFLDDFVGTRNGMGHDADYMTEDPDWFRNAAGTRAQLVRCEVAPCPWRFEQAQDLASFCRSLFGLQDVSDRDLLDTLDRDIGISTTATGVALDWELLYLQLRASS